MPGLSNRSAVGPLLFESHGAPSKGGAIALLHRSSWLAGFLAGTPKAPAAAARLVTIKQKDPIHEEIGHGTDTAPGTGHGARGTGTGTRTGTGRTEFWDGANATSAALAML